jgi:hypothetical protein
VVVRGDSPPKACLSLQRQRDVVRSLQNIIWEMSGRNFKVMHISCRCLPHTVLFPTTAQNSFSQLHVSAMYYSHIRAAILLRRHMQRILRRHGKYTHIRCSKQIIDVKYNIIQNKVHVQH